MPFLCLRESTVAIIGVKDCYPKGQKRKASSTVERDNVKRVCATNGSTKNTNLALTDTNTTVQTCKSTSSSGTSNPSRLKPPININNYTRKYLN
uniref:Uncharacterized protein n=1 Tax=Triatoma infestans TaxID=30076 RepID=A0A170XQP7_TRIIF